MTPELEALASKVKALAGPDREVDCLIGALFGLCPHKSLTYERCQGDSGHTCDACGADSWGNRNKAGQGLSDYMPRYTASLDAAMTLALPSWWFSASLPLSPDAYGYSREDQRMPRAGFQMIGPPYSVGAIAATLPLAIVAACLKGRARASAAAVIGGDE
jgi:hypothetical protein